MGKLRHLDTDGDEDDTVEQFKKAMQYPTQDFYKVVAPLSIGQISNRALIDNSYAPTYTTAGSMPSTSYQAGTFVINSDALK
jgi:hypothetical protein